MITLYRRLLKLKVPFSGKKNFQRYARNQNATSMKNPAFRNGAKSILRTISRKTSHWKFLKEKYPKITELSIPTIQVLMFFRKFFFIFLT